MANWKEGDRVRVVERTVTAEDRQGNRYFEHMAGLVGTVQNIYGNDEIAIKIVPESVTKVTAGVHEASTKRLRDKFASSVGEEQRKLLTTEELNFDTHYVLLVRGADLEKSK